MKKQERRSLFFIWKKGPVAKRILVSYLFVLLLPLVLTLVILTVTISRLQTQNDQHIALTARELSSLLGAHIGDIQTENTRISLMDETQKLASMNGDAIDAQNILRMRQLQRQLPRDTVASDYIEAIYIYFPKSNVILTGQSVYYDSNAAYMLRRELGMSPEAWYRYLAFPGPEGASLVTGDLDRQPHILVARQISPRAGTYDAVVISEFQSEAAVRLMDEFSENGTLLHSLQGDNGAALASSFSPADGLKYVEIITSLRPDSSGIHLSLCTLMPANLFLQKTAPQLLILLVCFATSVAFGLLMIHYFTRRQYTPIEQLNESLLATMNRNEANAENRQNRNEFEQMSEAITALLQTNASSQAENEQLLENLRGNMMRGVLFGSTQTEDIILRHAENNGVRFAGNRFLVALYAVEDLQQEGSSGMVMQSEETLFRLDQLIRAAISRLPDNGSTRYSVEIREKVACVISLPDAMSEEQIRKDTLTNIQQVREFFRNSFGLILTVAVSSLHSGVVSITTCYRECRETADYMELLGSNLYVCRYDQIPSAGTDTLSFPEVLEKEKKLCRNLFIGDYRSAEASWQDVAEALSLRTCSSAEAQARLLGAVSLMNASFNNLPPEMEDRVHAAFSADALLQMPDADSMLQQIEDTLAALAGCAAAEKSQPEDTEGLRYIAYVDEHITDPNFSISVTADHFNMSTSYFSRRFKKAAGENLLDYIHRQRLTLAKQIMAGQPEMTLKEICDRVGYSSPLTLNRAFRKYEGITPSDYRAQLST